MAPRDPAPMQLRHHPERSEGSPPRETRSTCPYCGVGCGVIVESQGTAITGVRGDPDHPANFGRLCTKGSTLHLTAAPKTLAHRCCGRSAARPRREDRAHQLGRGDSPTRRARSRPPSSATGPTASGFYISGQLLTEDYYVFNKLAKGIARHQQHRHQFAAVHVERGGGLQAHARRRRAAGVLRGHRPRAHLLHHRREHGVRAPGAVPTHRGREARAAGHEAHRRRSAPHRHRGGGRPAPADPARHRRRPAPRAAASAAVGGRRSTATTSRRTSTASTRCAIACATGRRRAPRRSAACRKTDIVTAARWFARGADAVAVLPGTQPVVAGHGQERHADQPASGHRADRQARRRAVVADRPAERDGRPRGRRHGEPAVRPPRSRERRASRRGRAAVARAPTCRRSPD